MNFDDKVYQDYRWDSLDREAREKFLERFSIEHFAKSVIGANLDQIRAIAKETHTDVQFSDRLFQDKYIVAGQGLNVILFNDEPLVIRHPDHLKVYLVNTSDGSFQKIFEEDETEYSVVGIDVSPDKQTILIMIMFDDFPKVLFIGEKNITDLDCGDLIGLPVYGDNPNPRWSEDDEDTIIFYNAPFNKFSSVKIDWYNKKASYIF